MKGRWLQVEGRLSPGRACPLLPQAQPAEVGRSLFHLLGSEGACLALPWFSPFWTFLRVELSL